MIGPACVGAGDHIVAEFIKLVDEYVESHYAAREVSVV